MAGANNCVLSNISQLLTLLMTLQSAALNNSGGDPTFDPKNYIDLSLRKNVSILQAEHAYAALPIITNETLHQYISDYFDPADSELEVYAAPDFLTSPCFLPNVRNDQVSKFALQVHDIWKKLTRHEISEVAEDPDRFTMVPLQNAFVIPGSRFREIYYWDSYWVIRGLLVSRMLTTARGIVDNLLGMVESYGFVPNGARKYYLNRSQPPLLSQMVKSVFEATHDMTLVSKALPILMKEHAFWTSAPHNITIIDAAGTKHSLSRYYANWNSPRPESYVYDRDVAESLIFPPNGTELEEEEIISQLYNDIATGAETGWDFSSRWMTDHFNLSTLRTSRIIPTDLNALLFQIENNIAEFARLQNDGETAAKYTQFAANRKAAIEAILWNDETKQWNDYWLPNNATCSGPTTIVNFDVKARNGDYAMASNFVPVWCGLVRDDNHLGEILGALKGSGLLQPAGIATTAIETGQQWDFPNGWAPLQHMIIEGLAGFKGSGEAQATAEEMAVRWVRTNHAAFVSTGAMHEKYDVRKCGSAGGGGEYIPQTGFGWSNGVVLAFLDHFGWPEERDLNCM